MRTVRLCLVGVALALVLIGVVSGTPVRYLTQVAPIALAMRLLARSPRFPGRLRCGRTLFVLDTCHGADLAFSA